uniref:Histone domain-containing protein n=1 Tax=Steinernema glaseri TaxID=37863 RepID=A0A1I7Z780_9BILA
MMDPSSFQWFPWILLISEEPSPLTTDIRTHCYEALPTKHEIRRPNPEDKQRSPENTTPPCKGRKAPRYPSLLRFQPARAIANTIARLALDHRVAYRTVTVALSDLYHILRYSEMVLRKKSFLKCKSTVS